MNAFKRVMKSKTIPEAICNIPESFFDFMSAFLIFVFMLNPVFVLIRQRCIFWFPDCWDTINRITLIIGAALIAMFVARYVLLGNKINIRTFMKDNLPVTMFFVFALVMILTTLINGHFDITLFGDLYRNEGLFGFLSYIVYFVLLIMISGRYKKIWLYTLIASSAIIELVLIYDCYAFGIHRLDFVFEHYNHFGYYLTAVIGVNAMLIITSEKIWQKIVFSVSFFVSVLALIANDTFGCQLAVVGGLVFICIMYSIAKSRFKVITLIPMALMVFTFIFALITSEKMNAMISANAAQIANDIHAIFYGREESEFSTGVSRMILWELGIDYIQEKPLIGHGPDVTGEHMITVSRDSDRCHCEYMNYAISFGVPAMLLYVAAVFTVYLRGLFAKKKLTDLNLIGLGAAMLYLFSAVVGNTMYYTTPFLFILLGMGYFREEKSSE